MDVVKPAMDLSEDQGGRRPTLAQWLAYLGLRLLLPLARALTVERLSAIGGFVLRHLGPHLRQNRRAMANLQVAFPERSEPERRAIARAMWSNMGRTFAETLVLDRLIADPSRLEIVDREAWLRRAADVGPIVGCTLHMGNWEIAIHPFSIFGREPAGVYKALENPLIDAWLRQSRRLLFPGGLLGKGDRGDANGTGQRTARQLIDKARSGGTLGFVADHFDRRGEPVPFLGRTARFTTVPASIARHVGARVWLGRCLRVDGCHFRFDIRELPVPRTADKKADATALTAAIFAVFDDWIREHPEQWMWWNTRWVQVREAVQPPLCQAA